MVSLQPDRPCWHEKVLLSASCRKLGHALLLRQSDRHLGRVEKAHMGCYDRRIYVTHSVFCCFTYSLVQSSISLSKDYLVPFLCCALPTLELPLGPLLMHWQKLPLSVHAYFCVCPLSQAACVLIWPHSQPTPASV